MSDDEPQPPAIYRVTIGRLTPRERSILVATATLAFVAGLWIGYWSIPDAALDVPKTFYERPSGGHWNAAYAPVPGMAIPASILLVLLGSWGAWRQIAPTVEERDEA